jgi:hypothetical protein
MQCKECGKEFRQSRWWQEFCSPKCRNDFHNHETSRALHAARRFEYAADVAAHEANGHAEAKMEIVAMPATRPKLVRRAVVVQPTSEKEEEAKVA